MEREEVRKLYAYGVSPYSRSQAVSLPSKNGTSSARMDADLGKPSQVWQLLFLLF